MAIRVRETHDSRAFDLNASEPSSEWKFVVWNKPNATEQEVFDAVMLPANTPYRWQGMIRGFPKSDPQGGGVFLVTVPYRNAAGGTEMPGQGGPPPPGSPPPPPPPPTPPEEQALDEGYSFEISRPTQKVYYSRATISKTGALGSTAPDYKGAIGVTADGIEGVEYQPPPFTITITRDLPFLTLKYLKQLAKLCWTTNRQTWMRFAPFDAVFLGASGNLQKSDRWTVSYKIGVGFTELNIRVGTGITVPVKRGSDYLWVAYHKATDMPSERTAIQPLAAYVEQIYRDEDWANLLGFGA